MRTTMAAVLALGLGFPIIAAHAVEQAFVASDGADVNAKGGCTLSKPCRTFAVAASVADPGGDLVALDSADFGPVVVDKSLTIAAVPGARAGIAVSRGSAVKIAATGVKVTLRRLDLHGRGGDAGVEVIAADVVNVHDCVIAGFANQGAVAVRTGARVRILDTTMRDGLNGVLADDGASVLVHNSRITGMSSSGISVTAQRAGDASSASVTDTLVAGTTFGIIGFANAGASVRIVADGVKVLDSHRGVILAGGAGEQRAALANSVIAGNDQGLVNQRGTLESLGSNVVRQNRIDVQGIVTPVAPQ